MWGEITVDKGRVQQFNLDRFRVMPNNEAPQVDIVLVASREKPGGIGDACHRAGRSGGGQCHLRGHRQATPAHAVHAAERDASLTKTSVQFLRDAR